MEIVDSSRMMENIKIFQKGGKLKNPQESRRLKNLQEGWKIKKIFKKDGR